MQENMKRDKRWFKKLLSVAIIATLLYSCASIGRPDGGAYDETPPRFIRSTPSVGELNVKRKKLTLEFDEFIKLEKASEKVVISPPQVQMPEISAAGKKIHINLLDTLKANTTYTVDFSDAIVDNNEGNPLGNFTYSFSTGEVIDTMEVRGTLLEASNLEPIKGMLVGLHSNVEDSAFTTTPFDRVARTDSRGRFIIKGVAPGSYRVFALDDTDQNFIFSQKSEKIAFFDSIIVPRLEERSHWDTIFRDSLTIDTIFEHKYTHYLPDRLTLRAFTEDFTPQYLIKNERLTPEKFSFYFAAKSDSLPVLKGLNFDEREAFIIEKNPRNDTIHYWVKDSLLFQQDTLRVSLTYQYTDTTNLLVPRTDTLNLVSRAKKKDAPEPKKKKKKKNDDEEEEEETVFLDVNTNAPSSMDVYGSVSFTFKEPVVSFDSSAVHLQLKVDTLWQDIPFVFEQDSTNIMRYTLYTDWDFAQELQLTVDSAAIVGLYGLHSDAIKKEFKIKKEDDYSNIFFNIPGITEPAFVELLTPQDNVVRQAKVENGMADFYFLSPAKYGARLVIDRNGNGQWDTGNYEENRQPEEVYYYPQLLEPKANWDLNQDWNINGLTLDRQKPDDMKKQKPDEEKKKKTRTTNRR